MSKLVKIIAGVVFIYVISVAQEPNIVWTSNYGGPNSDIGYCVQQSQDGGFIIAGQTYVSLALRTDVYLTKSDALGNYEWSKTFGTSAYDNGKCVQQIADGCYVVTGEYRGGDYLPDIYLIKTSASGDLVWWRAIGTNYSEWGEWVEQTIDGGYIIIGGQRGLYQEDVYLVKTNSSGNFQWSQTYGGFQSDIGYCVQQTIPDHGYIITGRTSSFGNGAQIWLVKTDQSGNQQWDKKFGEDDWDEGRCVRQTYPDGGYVIVGTIRSDGIFMALLKTNPEGDIRWEKRLRPTPTAAARGYSVKQTGDGGYIAVGEAMLTDHWDIYVVKVDRNGNIEWQKVIDRNGLDDSGYSVDLVDDDSYIIAGVTSIAQQPPYDDVCLAKLGPMIHDTDDPVALAYNGNRHLVRTPKGDDLHLVYTRDSKICYMQSSDGGTNWPLPVMIGEGTYPAITLDSDYLPSVTWTDAEGGLWYRRQTAPGMWGTVRHLDDPIGSDVLHLNSPPSIAITPSDPNDIVHILVTRSGLTPPGMGENYVHTLEDFSFPISDPGEGRFETIEEAGGPLDPPRRSFPSVAGDFENTLHVVWQRSDTICYALKTSDEWWDNWGSPFEIEGIRSAHPFVETYGDSIFVVWQYRETPFSKEEIWRACRQIPFPDFQWENLSRTTGKFSLYPVNASGLATTFVDEVYPVPPDGEYEIYWKRTSDDPLHNISNSTSVRSIYPQTALKFDQVADNHLYVIWQEGNEEPYQIKFKREFVPDAPRAFFTSNNGSNVPSPYLVERDTFFSNWTIPVDAGLDSVGYRFRLEPGYFYTLVGVLYQQGSGLCRGWVKIDNSAPLQIAYNTCLPETIAVRIPPFLYEDSILSVTLGRISGDFITVGPIYIYRYEEDPGEPGGGPMSHRDDLLSECVIHTWPNPFVQNLSIEFLTSWDIEVCVSIYDVTGRLVKNLHTGVIGSGSVLRWQGRDEMARTVPQGIYFLRISNPTTDRSICRKMIKID